MRDSLILIRPIGIEMHNKNATHRRRASNGQIVGCFICNTLTKHGSEISV